MKKAFGKMIKGILQKPKKSQECKPGEIPVVDLEVETKDENDFALKDSPVRANPVVLQLEIPTDSQRPLTTSLLERRRQELQSMQASETASTLPLRIETTCSPSAAAVYHPSDSNKIKVKCKESASQRFFPFPSGETDSPLDGYEPEGRAGVGFPNTPVSKDRKRYPGPAKETHIDSTLSQNFAADNDADDVSEKVDRSNLSPPATSLASNEVRTPGYPIGSTQYTDAALQWAHDAQSFGLSHKHNSPTSKHHINASGFSGNWEADTILQNASSYTLPTWWDELGSALPSTIVEDLTHGDDLPAIHTINEDLVELYVAPTRALLLVEPVLQGDAFLARAHLHSIQAVRVIHTLVLILDVANSITALFLTFAIKAPQHLLSLIGLASICLSLLSLADVAVIFPLLLENLLSIRQSLDVANITKQIRAEVDRAVRRIIAVKVVVSTLDSTVNKAEVAWNLELKDKFPLLSSPFSSLHVLPVDVCRPLLLQRQVLRMGAAALTFFLALRLDKSEETGRISAWQRQPFATLACLVMEEVLNGAVRFPFGDK